MAKRRWASQDDPRLHTPSWLAIRRAWQAQLTYLDQHGGALYCEADSCLLPGVPIQCGGPRTPAHLDVGHRIPRDRDPRLTWDITDTRPEHARCNRSQGRRDNAAKQRAQRDQRPTTTTELTVSNNEW